MDEYDSTDAQEDILPLPKQKNTITNYFKIPGKANEPKSKSTLMGYFQKTDHKHTNGFENKDLKRNEPENMLDNKNKEGSTKRHSKKLPKVPKSVNGDTEKITEISADKLDGKSKRKRRSARKREKVTNDDEETSHELLNYSVDEVSSQDVDYEQFKENMNSSIHFTEDMEDHTEQPAANIEDNLHTEPDKVTDTHESSVLQISYEEFLKEHLKTKNKSNNDDTSVGSDNKLEENDTETKTCDMKVDKATTVYESVEENTRKQKPNKTNFNGLNNTSGTDSDSTENKTTSTPSIAMFFKKIDRKDEKCEKDAISSIKVRAEVHSPSPTCEILLKDDRQLTKEAYPNMKCIKKDEKKKKGSNVIVPEEDMDLGITFLECRDITPMKKKRNPVTYISDSDEDADSYKENEVKDTKSVKTDKNKKEVPEPSKKVATFLASKSHTKDKKTTQATLGFQGKIMTVEATEKPTVKTRVRKLTKETCEPLIKKPRNKRKIDKLNTSTPLKSQASGTVDGDDLKSRSNKRALRRIYKSELVDKVKRKSGIRLRLTSVGRKESATTSSEDNCLFKPDEKVKRMTKAKKLLQKAKLTSSSKPAKTTKNNTKSKTKKSSLDDSLPPRRSSRHCAKAARVAISDQEIKTSRQKNRIIDSEESDEDFIDVKIIESPKKKGITKSKKHTAKKLAPIFLKKPAKEEVIIVCDESTSAVDPEALKRRQEFLSGKIPEQLKKQLSATVEQTVAELDYPPFPVDNHIQQREQVTEGLLDVWNLSDIQLAIKDTSYDVTVDWSKSLSEFTRSKHKPNVFDSTIFKNFISHPPLREDVIKTTLEEIARTNVGFPVKRVYKTYKLRKDQLDYTSPKDEDGQKKSTTNVAEDEIEIIELSSKGTRRSKRSRQSIESDDNKAVEDSRKKKRKIKRNASNDDECSKEDKAPVKEIGNKKNVLWTDKYAPSNSAEIIGNSSQVKKLQSWLVEWKEKVDKETRRLKKLLKKEKAKRKKEMKNEPTKDKPSGWWTDDESDKPSGWWTDDESDFALSDLDDSDYEEEEEYLCNTMLITGPHGIGKTATVYGVAQELGYKVFEVNASTKRSGKQILSQLQEATQSYQVSKKNMDAASSTRLPSADTKPKSDDNLPKAFNKFFNNQPPESKPTKCAKEQSGKKMKKKKKEEELKKEKQKKHVGKNDLSKDGGDEKTKKGLDLSNVSLILFEEVDVIFEEDKGFWASIQSFMSLTKKPIIMTTSDRNFASAFDGSTEMENASFKTPTVKLTASYMMVMCLAEGIVTSYDDIYSLVCLHNGDIRRSVLSLQYWTESAGGIYQQSDVSDSSNDINTLRHVKKKRKIQPIIDDDTSCDGDTQDAGNRSLSSAPTTVTCHMKCLESMLGLSSLLKADQQLASILSKDLMKEERNVKENKLKKRITRIHKVIQELKNSELNILSSNVTKWLPLPTSYIQTYKKAQPTHKKRTRIIDDLYDSEASNSNDGTALQSQDAACSSQSSICQNTLQISSQSQNTSDIPLQTSEISKIESLRTSKVDVYTIKSVDTLAAMFDDLCDVDILEHAMARCNVASQPHTFASICETTLTPGLNDEFSSETLHRVKNRTNQDICSYIESSSCTRHSVALQNYVDEIQASTNSDSLPDEMYIWSPIEDGHFELRNNSLYGSMLENNVKVTRNVMSNLPLTSWEKRGIVLDYVPAIKSVCFSEMVRKASKAKRRFHHYLDSITLPLKTSTIEQLTERFL